MWRLFSTTWEDGIITEALEAGIPTLVPRAGKEARRCVNTLIHRPFLFSSELWSVFLWRNLRTLDTAATNRPQLYESC